MKKSIKALLSLMLVFTMVFGFSAVSFAAETVTVNFCERDATETDPVLRSLPVASITVPVTSTTTVKEAIDAAMTKNNSTDGEYSAEWIRVDAYGDYAAYTYLNSMTLDDTLYKNKYEYTTTADNKTLYTGTSWMWNFDGSTTYPETYMDQATVGSNSNIYLIYERSSFEF